MLSPNEPLPPDFTYNFPADLKNIVSYTTLKVLEGGNIPTLLTRNVHEMKKMEKEQSNENESISEEADPSSEEYSDAKSYQRIINRPVVKKENEGKRRERLLYEKPSLDITLPHVSIKIFAYSRLDLRPLFYYCRYQFIDT